MWTEIKLADNCKISYDLNPKYIRRYNFEYIGYNGIKYEIYYEIYLVNVNFKDKFMVSTFGKDNRHFDTYDEAVAHVMRELGQLHIKIKNEEQAIQRELDKYSRRGRKRCTQE